jgi:hypothetical protein
MQIAPIAVVTPLCELSLITAPKNRRGPGPEAQETRYEQEFLEEAARLARLSPSPPDTLYAPFVSKWLSDGQRPGTGWGIFGPIDQSCRPVIAPVSAPLLL